LLGRFRPTAESSWLGSYVESYPLTILLKANDLKKIVCAWIPEDFDTRVHSGYSRSPASGDEGFGNPWNVVAPLLTVG
jgi:hypothetical protein